MSSIEEALNPVFAAPDAPHQESPRPASWARDFAVVGGVSSFLAPFLITGTLLGWPTLLATTVAGTLTGAVLGRALQRPFRGRAQAAGGTGGLTDLPWPLLVVLFLAVGACWGAVVGGIGATLLSTDKGAIFGAGRGSGLVEVYLYFMSFAALVGAAQLAWFGVVYARIDRAGWETWPILVAACGTPFLGWLALHGMTLGVWLLEGMR